LRSKSKVVVERIKFCTFFALPNFKGALGLALRQAKPLQDLDENARRIAMAMEKAAEETLPEKEMITKKWITPETLSLVQEKKILKKKRK